MGMGIVFLKKGPFVHAIFLKGHVLQVQAINKV